jgi:hypothetical protein
MVRAFLPSSRLVVFLLALTVRLALILATGSYQRPERTEVVNIAIKLADNG